MITTELPSLPSLPTGPREGAAGEGEISKHRYSIERLPQQDCLIVRRDGGEAYTIPMRLLAEGKTVSEIYEELISARNQ